MEDAAVPFDAGQMLTVSAARELLAANEPRDYILFPTREPDLAAIYGKGWAEGELTAPAAAWLDIPGRGLVQLTREAARQLGSTAKVNQKYQEFVPPGMLSEMVTFALREGLPESDLKLLIAGYGEGPMPEEGEPAAVPLAVAQCRATVVPFSNVRLLDVVLLTIRKELGHEAADSALVDYKFWHNLEHTAFRVVVPAAQQVITGTGTAHDAWCYGIDVANSLIGLKQTIISGYLFRLGSTGGVTDIEHGAGGFSRRGSGPEDVFFWTQEAVTDILKGRESAFAGLQVLTGHPADRDYATVLGQMWREHPVAKEFKLQIIAGLEDIEHAPSMYDVATAVAEVANLDGTGWRGVQTLQELAGYIVHQGGGMCAGQLPEGCRRLLPGDWEASAEVS